MAKTKRELIVATFIISCAATVFSIVSMATEEWVKSDLKAVLDNFENADINYGLFGGTLVEYYLGGNSQKTNKIAIACNFGENICGFSSATKGDARITELNNILNQVTCKNNPSQTKNLYMSNNIKTTISPNVFLNTNGVSSEILNEVQVYHYDEPKRNNGENNDIESHELDFGDIDIELLDSNKTDTMRYTKVKRGLNQLAKDGEASTSSSTSTSTKNPNLNETGKCDPTFLNAGLWLMTIIFLSLSIMLATLTAVISVMNTAGNPISPWLNIWGLYIWNGISSGFILLTMLLWGIHYAVLISYNVGTIVTLNGSYANDNPSLGFSYWMLFAPLFLHMVNIGLFYFRQHLIEQEPEINEEKVDTADRDGMIFVY